MTLEPTHRTRIYFITAAALIALLAIVGYFVFFNKTTAPIFHLTEQSAAPQITNGPGTTNGIPFKNYGSPPLLTGAESWINGAMPDLTALKGKVVLINFWTLSCASCNRLLPTINQWQSTYGNDGLVVIGIHTPQYIFEKNTDNVQTAITRFGITYPVAIDNNYTIWKAFKNQLWPAQYLIDKDGKIVYTNLGDGNESITENAIKELVSITGGIQIDEKPTEDTPEITTKIIIVGTKSAAALVNTEKPTGLEQIFAFPQTNPKVNTYTIEGTWKIDPTQATLTQGYGRMRFTYNAKIVNMTASSIKPVKLKILIDGKTQPDITVQENNSYTLVSSDTAHTHTIEMQIPQPGFVISSFVLQ